MRNTYWIVFIAILGIVHAGCSPIPPGTEQPAEVPASDPQEIVTQASENPLQSLTTPESTEMPANPPPVEKFVALSKKDLANRLQIDAAAITVLKTEEIVWPNSALGCPRPEKVYPGGRVPGFQIWLETNGTTYLYNTDYSGQVILCPELNPNIPGSIMGPTPDIGVPIP
jgi:hypothetical protein